MAVIDGYNACVYVDPTLDLLKSLKKRQQEDQKKQALLQELKGKPNTTLDGKTINVFANIGGMGDVGAVQQNTPAAWACSAPSSSIELQGLPPRTTSSRPTSRWWRVCSPQGGRPHLRHRCR